MNDVIPILKHNPSAQVPAVLEAITVQREPLISTLVDSVLDTDGGLRHHLLIGPRGMGKTHLLSLVASRVREAGSPEKIAIAWLREDPWSIRSYQKFLAAILLEVADELGEPDLAAQARAIRTGDDEGAAAAEQAVRDAIGDRRLVLIVENLDEIFRRIGEEGQAKFRAFAEEWRSMLIVASAPQLFAGIREQTLPFYGFFAITHLEELTVASATELMRRIAILRKDLDLEKYMESDAARQRIRAIEALAGGHPRIWLLFAGCISIAAIDELVPLFLEALDELTPYYQARLRELSDQQQELVVLLSEAGGALNNSELAQRSGIAQNQVATMLRGLSERGYVRRAKLPQGLTGGDGRMSFWELREPLMRLCLDIKEARGEPLRMVIEFLRAWYGPKLLDELVRLPPDAELAKTYASEAFRSLEGMDFDELMRGSPKEILARTKRGLALRPEAFELKMAQALGLLADGRGEEAREELERLLEEVDSGMPRAAIRAQLVLVQHLLGEQLDIDAIQRELATVQEREPDNPVPAVLAAALYTTLDRHDLAADAYARAVALDPDEEILHSGLGEALIKAGRAEEGMEALRRAANLAPEKVEVQKRLALALETQGRFEEALAAFDRARAIEPENVRIESDRALSLYQLDRNEEALSAARRAVDFDTEEPRANETLGWLLSALGRHEEAVAVAEEAVRLAPERASAHSNLGTALGRNQRFEEGLAAFARASELDPTEAQHEANRALALRRLGRGEEALAVYERAIELAPKRAYSHAALGETLFELGRGEDALEHFERACELDPTDAALLGRTGQIFSQLGRNEDAVAWLRRAIELDDGETEHWLHLGYAHFALGRYEDAAEAFGEASRLAPGSAAILANQGSALANHGRHEEALTVLGKAVELEPDHANLRERRGFVLGQSGRTEEARAEYELATRLAPDNPRPHNLLADSLRELGRLEEARAAVLRAIELEPRISIYRFTLAEIELTDGEEAQALAALDQAVALWSAEDGVAAGDPELLVDILWGSIQASPDPRRLLAAVLAAFAGAEAVGELGRGLVSSIGRIASEDVSIEKAEEWLAIWRRVGVETEELEIPLAMMEAALGWRRDGERAHLIALPAEQREIVIDLLGQGEA